MILKQFKKFPIQLDRFSESYTSLSLSGCMYQSPRQLSTTYLAPSLLLEFPAYAFEDGTAYGHPEDDGEEEEDGGGDCPHLVLVPVCEVGGGPSQSPGPSGHPPTHSLLQISSFIHFCPSVTKNLLTWDLSTQCLSSETSLMQCSAI